LARGRAFESELNRSRKLPQRKVADARTKYTATARSAHPLTICKGRRKRASEANRMIMPLTGTVTVRISARGGAAEAVASRWHPAEETATTTSAASPNETRRLDLLFR